MIRCDEQGIPKIVQAIRYRYKVMDFEVSLFDGRTIHVCTEYACPHLDLFDTPRDAEYRDVENFVVKHFGSYAWHAEHLS